MRFSLGFLLALFPVVANAHFQLQFPPPRGDFDEDQEPTFCDGYLNPATNRTQFPLSGGYYTINSEHSQWVAGVLVTTAQNPTSFANFSQVNTFGTGKGEGIACLPLDFSKSNVTGLQNGENATIQIVFNGGDGVLYQCADVVLTSNLNLSASVSCSNSTTTTSAGTSNLAGPFSLLSALAGLSGVFLL